MPLQPKLPLTLDNFRHTMIRCLSSEIKTSNKPPSSSGPSNTVSDNVIVSNWRKRLFVMAGIYKNMKDVPVQISRTSLAKNMDRLRVRLSLVLISIGIVGAFSSSMLAKDVLADLEKERTNQGK